MKQYLAHSAKDTYPAQPYEIHIRHVLKKVEESLGELAPFLSENQQNMLGTEARLAAIYHDLGKLEPENQDCLSGVKPAARLPLHHMDAGCAFLLPQDSFAGITVYSHHVGLPNFSDEFLKDEKAFRDQELYNRTNRDLPALLSIQRLLLGTELEQISSAAGDFAGNIQVFLRLLLSIQASADFTDAAETYGNSQLTAIPRLRAEERLKALDAYVQNLGKGESDTRNQLRLQFYREMQEKTMQAPYSFCDAPVGSGKTTAVMAHLLRQSIHTGARRIFVILPFTNIINQSVKVYRKALTLPGENPREVVAAVHSKVDFEQEAYRQLSSSWQAPVIVTTAVAFFETLASNRPSVLRRLQQLPGSVFFLDEAHTQLPLSLIPLALKWITCLAQEYSCYWVFASGSLVRYWEIKKLRLNTLVPMKVPALLQENTREILAQYDTCRLSFRWRAESVSKEELVQWVSTAPGPRLLIVNTVQTAAVLANLFEQQQGREKVEHLSTALTPFHREKVLEVIQRRLADPKDWDWTLVATSCVEAGVDMSFRSGFRESASVISLLQTAGRINRNGENQDAAVWTFLLQDDPMLTRNKSLQISSSILQDYFKRGETISPELSTQSVLDEIHQDDKILQDAEKLLIDEESRSFADVCRDFKVIDEDTVPVIVDTDLLEKIQNKMASWNDFQMGSVSIRRSCLEKWKVQAIDPGKELYRWTLGYDMFIGYMKGVLEMVKQ